MGLIRFIQDHNRNVELKKMRQLHEKPPLDDVKCQICGLPRGNQHFYVVNKKDQKLIVCGQCVETFRNEKRLKNQAINPTCQNDALSILKTRYAKGEITKEQYEQIKKDLEEDDNQIKEGYSSVENDFGK